MPSIEQEWNHVADGFDQLCQFKNCLGAIDGKHIIKKTFRKVDLTTIITRGHLVVLFAVVNANYEFFYIHMGVSDGGIWKENGL